MKPTSNSVFEGQFPIGYGGIVQLEHNKLFFATLGVRGSISEDGGRNWSEPFPLRGPEGPFEGKPVGLIRLASGALAMHYCTDRYLGGYHGLWYRWSVDEGATWSEAVRINQPGATAWPLSDAMVQIRSGRLLLPVFWCFGHRAKECLKLGASQYANGQIYGHSWIPEMSITCVYLSDDEGKTWFRSDDELMLWVNEGYGNMASCDEPTVAQMSNGNLILFMRTTQGRIVQSISEDDGETWSLAALNSLCNSDSPPRIRRIPSTGDLHCVWNNVTIEENRRGFRRSRLTSAVSRDNARTWQCFRNLECYSALEDIAEIHDPEEPQFVKQGEASEGLPRGLMYRYPNMFYIEDRVIFMYSYEHKIVAEGLTSGESDMSKPGVYIKLLSTPIDWVYNK